MKKKLILISLNELNFDILKKYLAKYNLKNFKKIIDRIAETESEKEYEKLEPWIQWPSVYTGLKADDHKIFRLGDITKFKGSTFFNDLENLGFKIGAVSPMNMKNNFKNPLYFIPDPWTKTNPDKNFWTNLVSKTISKIVIKNSENKINILDFTKLILIFFKFANVKNYFQYVNYFFTSFFYKWRKALFLDLLLNDIHLSLIKKKNPHFSNIFFNGIAHIQHHYFFNSSEVNQNKKIENPKWYVGNKKDPIKEAFFLYDNILKSYIENRDYAIVIATGLTQIPYDTIKFYYKIKNHPEFFSLLDINCKNIQELMSRDFIINFESQEQKNFAHEKLINIKLNEINLFKIENRENDLFVTFVYPNEILNSDKIFYNNKNINIKKFVSFVAIKNGMHFGKGFYYDNFSINKVNNISITEIKSKIMKYFINNEN